MKGYSKFEEGYIDAMFWANSGDEEDELTEDHCYMSLAPETIASIKADCTRFIELAGDLLDKAGDDSQNGHDFWLTRCGHGAGFWDRGYPEEVGDGLSKICETMGEVWVTAGDDGKIYM